MCRIPGRGPAIVYFDVLGRVAVVDLSKHLFPASHETATAHTCRLDEIRS
jgi:hypothetical protein